MVAAGGDGRWVTQDGGDSPAAFSQACKHAAAHPTGTSCLCGGNCRLSDGRGSAPGAVGTAIHLWGETSNMVRIFKFNLVTVPQPPWGFCLLETLIFSLFFFFHKSAKLFKARILKLEDAALKKRWIFYEGFWDFMASKYMLQPWRLRDGATGATRSLRVTCGHSAKQSVPLSPGFGNFAFWR